MKCMTQGTLISQGSNKGQCEGIRKVFTGSCDLLFMLCFEVDLVLNGMAGTPFRWRTFITITSPKLLFLEGLCLFLRWPHWIQDAQQCHCNTESESKRSWHRRAQTSCSKMGFYFKFSSISLFTHFMDQNTHTPSKYSHRHRICPIYTAYFTFIDREQFRLIYYKRALF